MEELPDTEAKQLKNPWIELEKVTQDQGDGDEWWMAFAPLGHKGFKLKSSRA